MNRELEGRYNQMWENARSQFNQGNCNVDQLIDDEEDHRRGMTLLARPNQKVKEVISNFQNELRRIEPNQYYQPQDDLHLTVLSIISCDTGFELSQINLRDYERMVRECISEPITINFEGITASSSGILVQGFPEGEGLKELRNGLRNKFKSSQLQHSIDCRYKINTAHITIMRFRKPLVDSIKFVKLLDKFRSYSFGTLQISHLHLVFNDWYQRTEIVKKLATFELS
ncbi:MAG: mutarotase [Reichenbachiella sp.]|uniref:2'-5' RNA ligase family protein n=1 Tax=Reichenbachiella sp. TaxID=2184521 RepID=UPI0032998688